ncbi:ABC transporter ATP-binding protein [Rhizomonospora bruguierae]|uniref:ABC transporter ATP-binding protein n=1 Tax=Rhizomonospora bruguierae TaxID=1581705 RepID=UPI001BCF4189|nr:ABC transporter ATP-binding protein [Micromonospora sp. NBRC 107566]
MRESAILDADGVSKSYTTKDSGPHPALSNVSLTVAKGEFLSIIGPSGCGKTTLLKICAGLLAPSTGSLSFKKRPGPPRPRSMGVVFQTPALLPWRTVRDNVLLPAIIQHADRKAAEVRAVELLEMLNLAGTADKYPFQLSGGMQQRVAIARSLLLDPEIIFMDEPFGALDAMTREKLNIEVQNVHARTGATIIFVTHNISEAVFLSDRIVAMSAGPGRISSIVTVDLPRPRTANSYVLPEFREQERIVRDVFDTAATS